MSKNKKRRGSNQKNLDASIKKIFFKNPKKLFNYKQLSKLLTLSSKENASIIIKSLDKLKEIGIIEEIRTGKFQLISIKKNVRGYIDINSLGNGYVSSEDFDVDIFIHKKNVGNVVSGDLVDVQLLSKHKKHKPEGIIDAIIERNTHEVVGVVEMSNSSVFVVPHNPRIHFDVFVPKSERNNISDGQMVVVEIVNWGIKKQSPTGKVIDVLGYPGDNQTEIHAILSEFNLPYKFTEEIIEEANNISKQISSEEIKKRRDFRKVCCFTIDPKDAKDFDDALSIQQLSNGNLEIGIHIADVSYYLEKNGLLDREAQERATSVYLVDRVVPMLPETLSNELCSLKPKEEKLCFSAVFELDEDANLKDEWFGKTIIVSKHRFTYEKAQEIIKTKEGLYSEELITLNSIAKKRREKRMKSGAFSFERSEIKFNLDKEGNPTSIYTKESKDAHKLIEEFMLLANKRVAEYIGKQRKPFVYRTHDSPDPEKLYILSLFLKKFGYHLNTSNVKSIASSMNKILKDVKGTQESNMIETLSIRTMAKAEYTTENIGHYGLSFDYYTHFTSPIRRYPDVIVHRLLESYLNQSNSTNTEEINRLCKHSSEQEIRASKAERASIKFMQTKFMKDKVGQKFTGVISGVTHFGMFVEISETACEGLIKIKDIPGDFYIFDEDNFCLKGLHRNQKFQIGDKIRVLVRKVDLIRKEINLNILL